jgi:hypothetical protein
MHSNHGRLLIIFAAPVYSCVHKMASFWTNEFLLNVTLLDPTNLYRLITR